MPSSARRAVNRLSSFSRSNAASPTRRMFWNLSRCIFFTFPLRVAMKMNWSASGSGMATTAVTVSSFGLMASIRFWMGVPRVWRDESSPTSNTRLR